MTSKKPGAKRAIAGVKAEELMTKEVICITSGMRVKDAINLLLQHRISGAPITDDRGKVLSIVSEFDLMRFAAKEELDSLMGNLLSQLAAPEKVISVGRQASFAEVFKIFLTKNIRRVLVTDNQGKLFGIIARGDIMRAFMEREGTA